MRKLRVLVLVHDVLVPPPEAEQLDWQETWTYQMELDVKTTLLELGHDVEVLGVGGDLRPIRDRIEQWRPHLAFNIVTDFHGVTAYEAHLVSYLELLKQPYTGCNPRGILLANDKALSKKVLQWHGIPTPRFAEFPEGVRKLSLLPAVGFPVIVKSAVKHGSAGIAQASIVHDDDQLRQRVEFMHRRIGGLVIAEQFIPGRELTVAIVGNDRLDVFPVWELWYENLPKGNHAIATEQVKWNVDYAQGIGIRGGPARDLDVRQQRRIQRIARETYRALGMSGYGRVDLRMDEHGQPFVIEANPNPDLTAIEDFAESAQAFGYDYKRLVQKVLDAGMRYRPGWKRVDAATSPRT